MVGEIENYGVWVGRAVSFTAQTAEMDPYSPHIHLKFKDNQGSQKYTAAINVKSTDPEESRLVFWIVDSIEHHPIIQQLNSLDFKFYPVEENPELHIDYNRTSPPLMNFDAGSVLPHDIPGTQNDILDTLRPILNAALEPHAKVCIFGSRFDDRKGIHNVHMNQGSLPKYRNQIHRDGAVFFCYPDGNWKALYLAFASQRLPTGENGEAVPGAKSLVDKLAPTGQ